MTAWSEVLAAALGIATGWILAQLGHLRKIRTIARQVRELMEELHSMRMK